MKKAFLTLAVLCTVLSAFAQRFNSFSNDPSKTVEEMKMYLATVSKDRQKEANDMLDEFTAFWTTSIDYENQLAFIQEANALVRHKFRPIPQFQSYMHAYMAYVTSEYATESETWVKMVEYHATHSVTQFQKNMLLYERFFKNNILNQEDNVKWVVDGQAEVMGFDQEPYFDFKRVDLLGHSVKDSLMVMDVTGRYYPAKTKFVAKQGTTYWDRAGLPNNVKADLKNFDIDMRFPKVQAENVAFYYPKLFTHPIMGTVIDKAVLPTSEEKATYPRFISNDKTIAINNLYPDVNYVGGFELRGASIYGTSTGDILCNITIMRDKDVIIRASSHSFLIRPTNLLSEDAKVSIYIEEDSIFHPAANFKYNNETKELLISRPKQGVGRSPFFDSYHKLDITVESIQWNTNEQRIEFKPIVGNTSEQSAFFESQNYYDESVMHEIAGVNTVNPLYTLWQLFASVTYNRLEFNALFVSIPLDGLHRNI